jgi:alpha-tubulin suppressor-like RCC1 family protein
MSEKRIVFLKRFKVLEKLKEEFLSKIKYTYAFQHKANECNIFIITNEDKVYGFGYNKRGVLGFGHDKNVKLLTLNEELSNKQIINFKDSFWHVMARTIDGKVYCWGKNVYGGLGNGKRDNNFYKPTLNEYLNNEQIIDICCEKCQSFALSEKGEVYGWGNREEEDRVRSESQLIPIKLIGFNNENLFRTIKVEL